MNDKFKRGLFLLVITALLAVGGFIHRSCSSSNRVHVVRVDLPPLRMVDNAPKVLTTIPDGVDTTYVGRVLRERDSLRKVLQAYKVRTALRTDTVVLDGHGTADTVRVECDDVNRTISLDIRPGTRLVQVLVPVVNKPWIETYVQGGVFYDGIMTQPYGALGASISIGSIALVVQAESRIDPARLRLQPGINVGIRYNF